MDQDLLNIQAEMVASKIKHYLITMMGITVDEANNEEFYRAFAMTLREEIMINWTASFHTMRAKKSRILYYLCMEYMPGRMLGNNITNMHATDLVMAALKRLGRDFHHIAVQEKDPGLGNGGLAGWRRAFSTRLQRNSIRLSLMGFGISTGSLSKRSGMACKWSGLKLAFT